MTGTSDSNIQRQPSPKMLPPRQQPRPGGLQASLSLVSSDACLTTEHQDPRSNSDHRRESPSGSAGSRETWPTVDAVMGNKLENRSEENDRSGLSIIRRVSVPDKISLRNIARDRVDTISERMQLLPDEVLQELKTGLRVILEGNGGSQHRDEFSILQRLVLSRADLTAKTLIKAHRVQLEILVSIKTAIQVFLHPNVSLSHASLIEVFMFKRCRNLACQSPLPAEDCVCDLCSKENGFCSLCMCVICHKFDFEVNTCRWVGCDTCSHWTHTDCAIHDGQICMDTAADKNSAWPAEMIFRCRACNSTSELIGWVKDVFQHCAPAWDRESLVRELDFVSRIFRGSQDSRGRKLFWRCENLIEKLKSGESTSTVCREILIFYKELEADSPKSMENGDITRPIAPKDACNRIAEVAQEAIKKMEMVAEEKMRMLKKARLGLQACEREFEDKVREVTELKQDKQRKAQQIDELEGIVRLKQAEADMFQLKANEARREAERLQRIALSKAEKSEEDYASSYLKLRLSEAEAEKQYLLEMIKLEENARACASHSNGAGGDASHVLTYSKVQELLKNAYNKGDGQQK